MADVLSSALQANSLRPSISFYTSEDAVTAGKSFRSGESCTMNDTIQVFRRFEISKQMKSLFAKKQITPFLTILQNHVSSLCIPINLNPTAVGLFCLG